MLYEEELEMLSNEGGREEEDDIDFDALPPRKRIGLPDDLSDLELGAGGPTAPPGWAI